MDGVQKVFTRDWVGGERCREFFQFCLGIIYTDGRPLDAEVGLEKRRGESVIGTSKNDVGLFVLLFVSSSLTAVSHMRWTIPRYGTLSGAAESVLEVLPSLNSRRSP